MSEEFEVIEVCGQTALYVDARVSKVPPGIYKYEMRHGDDEYFCSLERFVVVNFSGTVMTKEPIDLGRDDRIDFDEDTSPNFTGELMTIQEFLKRN